MPSWSSLRAALVGAVALGVLMLLGGAAILYFGLFDVSAASMHLRPVSWVVHRVMMHSVARRAGHYAPAKVSASLAAGGACVYRQHCQTCHGGPAVARDDWANGLNPPPPYLLDARLGWKPSELHWIISNGVKMTAMPAWKASMNDRQIWSLVAFLETMPDLPTPAYKRWSMAGTCPSGAEFAGLLGKAPAVISPGSQSPPGVSQAFPSVP